MWNKNADYRLRSLTPGNQPSSSSLFFLTWLASLARTEQLGRPTSLLATKSAHEDAELLGAARPLADLLHVLGRQPGSVHQAALRSKRSERLVLGVLGDLLSQRNDVLATPHTKVADPSLPSKAGESAVPSVARRARLDLHHEHLECPSGETASASSTFLLASKPAISTTSTIADAVQTLFQVVGNQVF